MKIVVETKLVTIEIEGDCDLQDLQEVLQTIASFVSEIHNSRVANIKPVHEALNNPNLIKSWGKEFADKTLGLLHNEEDGDE